MKRKHLITQHDSDSIIINEMSERINKLIKKYRISFEEIKKAIKNYKTIPENISINEKISGSALRIVIKIGEKNLKKYHSNSQKYQRAGGGSIVKAKRIKFKNEKEERNKKVPPIRVIKVPMGGKPK